MQVKSYTATGPQFSELEAALTERFTPEESHTGDGFAVLMIEKYEFWRTNSNMQVTIILESLSENSCLVKLTVGGGRADSSIGLMDRKQRYFERLHDRSRRYLMNSE
ncbi:hypothetical protein [Haladaptatus sp. CMAA 1911]|uniref:hypothetical protein n=1 Tax=unclassified Haladaptatus TaxID=2622732 RepID=UPI0037550B96